MMRRVLQLTLVFVAIAAAFAAEHSARWLTRIMSERDGAVDEHSFIIDLAEGTVFDPRQGKHIRRGLPGFSEYLESSQALWGRVSKAFADSKCLSPHPAPTPVRGTPHFPSCDKPARRPVPGEEWDRLERVAREHAPVFWLHGQEPYRPVDPEAFLRASTMTHVQEPKHAAAGAARHNATQHNTTQPQQPSQVPESVYALNSPYLRAGAASPAAAANVPIHSDLFIREGVLSARYYPFFAYARPNSLELHVVKPSKDVALGKVDSTPMSERKVVTPPGKDLPPVKNPYLIFRNALPLAEDGLSEIIGDHALGNAGAHEGDWHSVEVLIDLVTNSVLGVLIEGNTLSPGAVAHGETRSATMFVPRSQLSFNAQGRVELYVAKSSHTIYTQLNTPWDEAHRAFRAKHPLAPTSPTASSDPELARLTTSTLDDTRAQELRDDDGNLSPRPKLSTKFAVVPTDMPMQAALVPTTTLEPSPYGRQRVFGLVLDCDMDKNYVAVALYDEIHKGVAWDAAHTSTFPRATSAHGFGPAWKHLSSGTPAWLDAPIRWGQSPAYHIPASHASLHPLRQRCASPAARAALVKTFRGHLERRGLLGHIRRGVRQTFAASMVDWMCNNSKGGGFFRRALNTYVDAPVGLLSPLTALAQNATDRAQHARCSAAIAAEKLAQADLAESVSNVLLKKQQTDRASAGAAQETARRQEELAQALAGLNAAERAVVSAKEKLTWAAQAKQRVKTELTQAHARVAEIRQALVRTSGLAQTLQQQLQHLKQQHRADLSRRRLAQRSAHFYGNRGGLKPRPVALTPQELQREHELELRLKQLIESRNKDTQTLRLRTAAAQRALVNKNAAVNKHRALAQAVKKREEARNAAQTQVQQARVLLATAQHHFELSAIRQAELSSMLQAAQRAEQRVLAVRRQSQERERIALEKIVEKARNATREWRVTTRAALQQKAKDATPAQIARLQTLIAGAKTRDEQALAAVHLAETKEREFARSHADEQATFAAAARHVEEITHGLKTVREALNTTLVSLQTATAAKDKSQKDYILRLRRRVHELQTQEKERVKARADAVRARDAAEGKVAGRVSEERKLRTLAETARARRAKTLKDLQQLEGELDDLRGVRTAERLVELETIERETKWIPNETKAQEALRNSLADDLRKSIARIRDDQKKEMDETQKAARALHEAKVAAFLTQTRAHDAELAVARYANNVQIAEQAHKRSEMAVNEAHDQVKHAEHQVAAIKEQGVRANATMTNAQHQVQELQKRQRSLLGEIARLSRPAAGVVANQRTHFAALRRAREQLTQLTGQLAAQNRVLAQARAAHDVVGEKLHTAQQLAAGRNEHVKQLEMRLASTAARVQTAKKELADAEKAVTKARHDEALAKQTYLRLEQSKQLRVQTHGQRI